MWQVIINNCDFILVVLFGFIALFSVGMIMVIGCHLLDILLNSHSKDIENSEKLKQRKCIHHWEYKGAHEYYECQDCGKIEL